MKGRERLFRVLDLETTSLNPRKAEIFSYCYGMDGNIKNYRLDGGNTCNKDRLQHILSNPELEIICHNMHYDKGVLVNQGYTINPNIIWHDTMIMSQLLNNLSPSHALDYLAWCYCGYSRDGDKEIKRLAKAYGGYQNVPKDKMDKYQFADGERTALLFRLFYPKIKRNPKLHRWYNTEIDLVNTTIRMENYGIKVSVKNTKKFIKEMEGNLAKLQEEVFDEYGRYINLNSDKQLRNLLFEVKDYPPVEKTKSGLNSTNKNTLKTLQENYDDPIFDMIIATRAYTNSKSILQGYLENIEKDNLIHPNIRTNSARTGRESVRNPNLQNVQKSSSTDRFVTPARECFIARENEVLFMVDYSGIEMRMIIDACHCKRWIKLLEDGGDPHSEATRWFYPSQTENASKKVFKEYRDKSKNGSFCLAYGGGLSTLANTLELPKDEAKAALQRYAEGVPEVAHFVSTIIDQVKKFGYVETPFGRKLKIPKDKPYIGANYLIQGTAAHVLKKAQVRLDNYFQEEWNDNIRIIVPIHDEVIFGVKRNLLKYMDKIRPRVNKLMTNMDEIKVKLDVDWECSTTTWEHSRELKSNRRRIK